MYATTACPLTLYDDVVRHRNLILVAEALSIYAACIAEASHHPSPVGSGLYIMTTHQAKGREFDAVIIAPQKPSTNPCANFVPQCDLVERKISDLR
jgi:hypothetical protein